VLAKEKSAGNEMRASAYPLKRVWPILWVDGDRYRCFFCPLPVAFKILSPTG
jgi:hypothetical protein